MTTLQEALRVRRASLLSQQVIEEEPKPTVVMSVYNKVPTFIMFGTVGAACRSVSYDVGAESQLTPDALDCACDNQQIVASLTAMHVSIAHVKGHEAEATTYVLPPNGPLHRWYNEQRSAAS